MGRAGESRLTAGRVSRRIRINEEVRIEADGLAARRRPRMPERKKITLPTLFQKVAANEPVTMLTCYDFPTATFQEQAGIDIILVGDSLGMTVLGYETTLPVTMDDMIRHTQAVRRGTPNAWLIGDMPYMSYQPSVETAIRN